MKKTAMILALLGVSVACAYAQNAHVLKDVTLTAQGAGGKAAAGSFFIGETGSLVGACDVKASEKNVDFVVYCNNAGTFVLYSPASAVTGIAKNFRCNGQSWAPAEALKETKFKVLVPGSKAVNALYEKYNAGAVTTIDDNLFAKISEAGANTVKYNPDEAAQGGSTFNTTSAYLIWFRAPQADGTFKNGLIRVKKVDIASPVGLSTALCDIMVQK